MKLPRDRFDYSPIVDRRPWKLPKGARIAVWTIVNIEEWDIEKPMARQYLTAPQGVATVPDVPNWAWHDYGMRVGFWRLLEALAKRQDPRHHGHQRPRRRVLRAGGAGHARRGLGVHGPRRDPGRHAPPARSARGHPPVRSNAEAVHGQEAQGLARAGPHARPGRRSTTSPRRGSSTSPTGSTTTSPTRSAPRRARSSRCPTRIELNDIPMMVIQHHTSSEWLQRAKDQFDRLYAEGAKNPPRDGPRRAPLHLAACRTGSSTSRRCTITCVRRRACGSPLAKTSTNGINHSR